MSEIRQPNFFQVLEARIALALAKAGAAVSGIAALQHNTSVVNGSAVGPAATIAFAAPSFTVGSSGKVLVMGTGIASGGTLAAGDLVSGILTRDGVTIPGSAAPFTAVAAEGTPVAATITGFWIDAAAPNTAHVWAIQAAIGGGHTAVFSIDQASVTLLELP